MVTTKLNKCLAKFFQAKFFQAKLLFVAGLFEIVMLEVWFELLQKEIQCSSVLYLFFLSAYRSAFTNKPLSVGFFYVGAFVITATSQNSISHRFFYVCAQLHILIGL